MPPSNAPCAPVRLRSSADIDASELDRWICEHLDSSGLKDSPNYYILVALGTATLAGMAAMVFWDDLALAVLCMLSTLGCLMVGLLAWRSWRRLQVRRSLPTALEMMARSIESGQGLSQSLSNVAGKTRGPLKEELQLFARQLEFGLPIARSIARLNRLYPLFEMRMLGSTLSIHQRSGGDLAHMLHRLAYVLEDREQYRKTVSSATVTARLSALIVGITGPGLVLYYLLERNYIGDLFTNPAAQFYLWLAAALELVGIVWLWLLAQKEF